MNGVPIDSGGAIAKTFMAECDVEFEDDYSVGPKPSK